MSKIFWYKDCAILSSDTNGSIDISHKMAMFFLLREQGYSEQEVLAWDNKKTISVNEVFSKIAPYLSEGTPVEKFYRDTYLYNEYGVREHPANISINIGDKCNLSCFYCGFRQKKTNYQLDTDKVLSVLEEASSMDGVMVHIAGGEPFLHKDIFEILKYASKLRLFLTISSNGVLLTKKVVENIKKIGLKRLQISLDTLDQDEFFLISNSRSIQRLKDNLTNISNSMIELSIRTVVTELNIESLMELAEFTSKLEIGNHHFTQVLPMFPYDMACIKDRPPENLVQRINDVVNKYKHCIFDDFIQPKECEVYKQSMVINSEGDVTFCQFIPNLSYGNIKQSKIINLWRSDAYYSFIRNLHELNLQANDENACYAALLPKGN